MKTITAGEFNAHFFEVLEEVNSGKKPAESVLGILDGKAKAVFASDFSITEEEFLGA